MKRLYLSNLALTSVTETVQCLRTQMLKKSDIFGCVHTLPLCLK